MAAVAMVVRGHSALTAMPFCAQFAGETQHHEAHAVLGDGIGGAAGKPFFPHVERGRIHQDVGIVRFFEMRDGVFRHHEGAARVDLMHQVEAAHVGIHDRRSLHGARIVDHDVDAAKGRDGPLDRAFHLRLVAHIDHERQRMSAGLGDFVRGGEDGAGEFRMRLVGLGRDGDVGAVARGAQRNRKPDAARCAGDEQCAAFERHRSRWSGCAFDRG